MPMPSSDSEVKVIYEYHSDTEVKDKKVKSTSWVKRTR